MKKYLKANSVFGALATVLLVVSCTTNTGLEVKVDLNDFVALTNIFTSKDGQQFTMNYTLEQISDKSSSDPTKLTTKETSTTNQVIFEADSNYLVNDCQNFVCGDIEFEGKELGIDEYNNLTGLPFDNNYYKNLESSQFSIDNLAKIMNIVPFSESEEIIYDFSQVNLTTSTANLKYYYAQLDESQKLYLQSIQPLVIKNLQNDNTIAETYNFFDLKNPLNLAMISFYTGNMPTLELNAVDEGEEPDVVNLPATYALKFSVYNADYNELKTIIDKLFYFANDQTGLEYTEIIVDPEVTPTTFADENNGEDGEDEEEPEVIEPNKHFTAKFVKNFSIQNKLVAKVHIEVIPDPSQEEAA
ncbi:hypothetical protein [Spiroplasma clarkii]|nr:hypothetical protein [Spiroplasma clarkii]